MTDKLLGTSELAEHLLRLCRMFLPEWIAKSAAETADWDAALGQLGDDDSQ